MNENANMTSEALKDNPYVQELFAILQENRKSVQGLSALLGRVSEMESFVKRAEDTISDMKSQLSEMKEVQDHPIKTSLQNAIKTLEHKVAEVKVQLNDLKSNIIDGCKKAVSAFKEKGVTALDKLASFFHFKDNLQDWNKNINGIIRTDDKAVAKIEAFASEYHSAGRSIRNMARVAIGREPVDVKKESGKLAKTLEAPYKAQKSALLGLQKSLNKAIEQLDRLEGKASKQVEQAAEKKPSLMNRLNENKERVEREKAEMALPERTKAQELEV